MVFVPSGQRRLPNNNRRGLREAKLANLLLLLSFIIFILQDFNAVRRRHLHIDPTSFLNIFTATTSYMSETKTKKSPTHPSPQVVASQSEDTTGLGSFFVQDEVLDKNAAEVAAFMSSSEADCGAAGLQTTPPAGDDDASIKSKDQEENGGDGGQKSSHSSRRKQIFPHRMDATSSLDIITHHGGTVAVAEKDQTKPYQDREEEDEDDDDKGDLVIDLGSEEEQKDVNKVPAFVGSYLARCERFYSQQAAPLTPSKGAPQVQPQNQTPVKRSPGRPRKDGLVKSPGLAKAQSPGKSVGADQVEKKLEAMFAGLTEAGKFPSTPHSNTQEVTRLLS